jgi:hypothetical protein
MTASGNPLVRPGRQWSRLPSSPEGRGRGGGPLALRMATGVHMSDGRQHLAVRRPDCQAHACDCHHSEAANGEVQIGSTHREQLAVRSPGFSVPVGQIGSARWGQASASPPHGPRQGRSNHWPGICAS